MGDLHLSLAAAAESATVTSALWEFCILPGAVGVGVGIRPLLPGQPLAWPTGAPGQGGGHGSGAAVLGRLQLQPEINLLG